MMENTQNSSNFTEDLRDYHEHKGFCNYSAANIANYLLDLGEEEKIEISCIKLNKLVYIVFGIMTVILKNKYLFPDRIEAWQYGPVIPNLYHQFKYFGNKDIINPNVEDNGYGAIGSKRAIDTSFSHAGSEVKLNGFAVSINNMSTEEAKNISKAIKEVWDLYKRKKPFELVDLTHKRSTPWYDCYKKRDNNDISTFNIEIKKSAIAMYYHDLLSLSYV